MNELMNKEMTQRHIEYYVNDCGRHSRNSWLAGVDALIRSKYGGAYVQQIKIAAGDIDYRCNYQYSLQII